MLYFYIFLFIFLSTFLYFFPIITFLPYRLSIRQYLTLYFLLFFSLILIATTSNAAVIFLLVVVSIYLCKITKKNLPTVCSVIVAYFLLVLIDQLISIVLTGLDYGVASTHTNYSLMTVSCLAGLTVELFICFLFSHFLLPFLKKKFQSVLELNEIWKLIFPTLFICLLIVLLNFIAGEKLGYTDSIVYFNFFLVVCYTLWTLFSTFHSAKTLLAVEKQKEKEKSYETLQQYTEKIENMNLELRTFKHDYANIMLSMTEYFEMKQFDKLEAYFYKKVLPFSRQYTNEIFRLGALINLKILELKGMISAKLIYAHEMGLFISIEILDPLEEISMETLDLARLLGIYLDNAVEAALQSELRQIWFAIVTFPNTIVISIKNTYSGDEIPYSQMKDPAFSTKGSLRGLGLYNAEKILSQYPHILHQATMKDHIFEQRLTIPVS